MAAAIEAHGLTKRYGGLRAVEELDLEVEEGVVLGFLGPNGAGKTTVIRLLTTILRPSAGSFAVAGVPDANPVEIRRRVGVLPEAAGYPSGQTGEEFLRYHARLFGRSRRDARSIAQRLLATVGLSERGASLVSGYSRGMRQRLGIARALVNDPRVVFLDEPTLGLDPAGQRQVLELVGRVAREHGATVVLSTHLLAEVEEVADQVLILHRGRVVAHGSTAEVTRVAAGPRRGRVRVPPERRERASAALAAAGIGCAPDGRRGELELTIPAGLDPERAAREVLRGLLAADVPVLGFTLEGGSLSDAFLAVTEAA
jgi:ABC-2 type transport system ATP-binding protein